MKSPDETARSVDPSVVQRIAGGDERAFAELYDSLSGPLFSLAYKILQDYEDARDVLQAVFLHIWKRADGYDPSRGSPFSWAFTLTRSRSIDRLRTRQRREKVVVPDVDPQGLGADRREDAGAERQVELREESGDLRNALTKLVNAEREAIELAFFSGLTQVEIAEKLQQPLGTVKARIRRGMLKLRDILRSRV